MGTGFQKSIYDDNLGFRLHHTKGQFAGSSTTGHLHYELEQSFIYFRHGIGEIRIEGRKYTIENGDLILLKPSELCQCTVKDGTYHERVTVYFNGSLLKNFGESGENFLKPFYQRTDGHGNKIPAAVMKERGIDVGIAQLLEIIKDPGAVNRIVSVCKSIEVLAKLRSTISCNSSEHSSQLVENTLVNNILAYINQNFSRPICLDDIAKAFFMDKYYISRLFKEQVGVTLWNYIIFRRITVFNDLIRSNASIEDACFRVGFQNYSNFFRLYKKHMQMTPSQFKKSIQKPGL